jgi:hypothetical protein
MDGQNDELIRVGLGNLSVPPGKILTMGGCPSIPSTSMNADNEVEGNVRLQIATDTRKVIFDMTYVSQS